MRFSELSCASTERMPAELDSLLRNLEDAAAASRHLQLNHSDTSWREAAAVVAASAHRFLMFVWQDPEIAAALHRSVRVPTPSTSQPTLAGGGQRVLARQLLALVDEKLMLVTAGSGLYAAAEVQDRRSGQLLELMARSRRWGRAHARVHHALS
jgi:hypothetical protein